MADIVHVDALRARFLALGVAAVLAAACGGAEPSSAPPASAGPPSSGGASATALATIPATPGSTTSPSAPAIAGWQVVSRLTQPHGSTHLLPAGDGFLVVGDDNVCAPGGAFSWSTVAELRDAAGSWRLVDPLPSPRDKFAAVTLQDGRVLVAGGTSDEEQSYSSAYIFDAASGSWTKTGLLNTARSEPFAAVHPDGRVLAGGGFFVDALGDNDWRPTTLGSTELFDPATGAWTPTGSLATPRIGASAVQLSDGRVLAVGGQRWLVGGAEELASAEIYDPQVGRWSSAGSLHEPRQGSSLVALRDGGALIVGGSVFGESAFGPGWFKTSTAERFDAATNSWTEAGALKVAAADRTAIRLADGRVLVVGGDVTQTADLYQPGYTAAAEIYDPASNVWSRTASMPGPRSGARAALLPDGSVLVAGGFSEPAGHQSTPSCPFIGPSVFRYTPGRPGGDLDD